MLSCLAHMTLCRLLSPCAGYIAGITAEEVLRARTALLLGGSMMAVMGVGLWEACVMLQEVSWHTFPFALRYAALNVRAYAFDKAPCLCASCRSCQVWCGRR